jgi:mercuric ion transport protein
MTTNTTKPKKPFGILGIGAAACAACCAGPILGFVAATGILTAGGLAAFGTVGLLVAIPAIALIVKRRRRPRTCAPPGVEFAVTACSHGVAGQSTGSCGCTQPTSTSPSRPVARSSAGN